MYTRCVAQATSVQGAISFDANLLSVASCWVVTHRIHVGFCFGHPLVHRWQTQYTSVSIIYSCLFLGRAGHDVNGPRG